MPKIRAPIGPAPPRWQYISVLQVTGRLQGAQREERFLGVLIRPCTAAQNPAHTACTAPRHEKATPVVMEREGSDCRRVWSCASSNVSRACYRLDTTSRRSPWLACLSTASVHMRGSTTCLFATPSLDWRMALLSFAYEGVRWPVIAVPESNVAWRRRMKETSRVCQVGSLLLTGSDSSYLSLRSVDKLEAASIHRPSAYPAAP
jgi:hypothetical protein